MADLLKSYRYVTGEASTVLADVELIEHPDNEAIKRCLDSKGTALIVVVCGGKSVAMSYERKASLDTLFTQMRLLLG